MTLPPARAKAGKTASALRIADLWHLLAAPGLDVNAAARDGSTALMRAADEGGHTETVTALLAAPGLDVNAADGDGCTALMRAALLGHTETVTVLLAAPGLDVNAANGDGYTAFMWAARGGDTETVTALLAAPQGSHRGHTLTLGVGLEGIT